MTDILEEIKEDIKYERYAYLWKKYGIAVVGTAVLVVIGTAVGVWYQSYQDNIGRREGSKLFQAAHDQAEGKTEAAQKGYEEVINSKSDATAAMASIQQAMALAKAGKIEQANPLFLAAIDNHRYPQEFRELAELMYVYSALQHVPEPTKDTALVTRLERLAGENYIWHYTAQELLAFYWLNSGEQEKAKPLFEKLKSALDAPVSIRQRAEEMLAVIG